jgi:hypothetical protein
MQEAFDREKVEVAIECLKGGRCENPVLILHPSVWGGIWRHKETLTLALNVWRGMGVKKITLQVFS